MYFVLYTIPSHLLGLLNLGKGQLHKPDGSHFFNSYTTKIIPRVEKRIPIIIHPQ